LTGELTGKVAIVTGAARGIGAAIARRLSVGGATVVIADIDRAELLSTAAELPRPSTPVAIDLTAPGAPDTVVDAALQAHGRLDIMVNNAGYTWDGPVHTMSDEQFQAMLDIHTVVPFRLLRAAAKAMRTAAKGAMIAMTKALAKEWGHLGINVNAVAAGFIETRLTADPDPGNRIDVGGRTHQLGISDAVRATALATNPLGHVGSPVDIAEAVAWLASPASNYVQGHVLTVSGGQIGGMTC
jgi:3-oxoacyl-[acyl-carrier protein] reductase